MELYTYPSPDPTLTQAVYELTVGLGRGRCEVTLIKTDIDLKYEWQNKIHMQIMFLEKNTIMISEVNMRRPQVISHKKKFQKIFSFNVPYQCLFQKLQ